MNGSNTLVYNRAIFINALSSCNKDLKYVILMGNRLIIKIGCYKLFVFLIIKLDFLDYLQPGILIHLS